MEGSGEGRGVCRCVLHVDVHGAKKSCCGCCNLIVTEHGRCGLFRIQKLSLYSMFECQLWCEFMLLLKIAQWVDCLVAMLKAV